MVERLLCIDTLLTLEMLKAMPPKTVFAVGKTVNSPEGVYMTDACFGRELAFVAERGQIHDWAIYIGWADMDLKWIEESGDKVYNAENIKKLVPCDEEAFKMYRE